MRRTETDHSRDRDLKPYAKLRDALIRSARISPLATVIADAAAPDHPIIAVNAAFEALTGYSEADVLGRNCRLLAGKETSATARAELRAAIESGRPAFVTLTNYRKSGESFENAVMIAPAIGDAGIIAFFVGTQCAVVERPPANKEASVRLACLTSQQMRVLEKMAQGLRHADIAAELGLSIKTVKMHRGALVKRLGVVTSTEAIRIAVEGGL